MNNQLTHYPLGDSALVLVLGNSISPKINRKVQHLFKLLLKYNIEGITEIVPAFHTVTTYYNPTILSYQQLLNHLQYLTSQKEGIISSNSTSKEIPVYYHGEDLNLVAEYNKLEVEEVIRLHSEAEYTVYMLGFTPGFPYLGGMNPQIATPRKEIPRIKVRAGSVGIGGDMKTYCLSDLQTVVSQ